MNIALLVIDMQKAFYAGDMRKSMENAAEYIDYTVKLFRKNNNPVIWIQDEDIEDGVIAGTEGFEIIDILKPDINEMRITKHYGNAFNKTGLSGYLLGGNIDTVILTGFSAEHCVLSTYRGALDYDFTPILLKKALAGKSEENIRFTENISNIITVNALQCFLK